MLRMSKITTRYLMERGFSIGIGEEALTFDIIILCSEDVTPSEKLTVAKHEAIDRAFRACASYVKQHEEGRIICQPGQTAEETLESMMKKDLNEVDFLQHEFDFIFRQVREEGGAVCRKTLSEYNAPKIMAKCGSKGSPINMAQVSTLTCHESIYHWGR